MSDDIIQQAADILDVHEVEFIDHEVGYECGCNEHGDGHPDGLRFRSDVLRHQAEALKGLLRDPERDAAMRREGAVQALRDMRDEMSLWQGYDTHDIGEAFLRESVLDELTEEADRIEGESRE